MSKVARDVVFVEFEEQSVVPNIVECFSMSMKIDPVLRPLLSPRLNPTSVDSIKRKR